MMGTNAHDVIMHLRYTNQSGGDYTYIKDKASNTIPSHDPEHYINSCISFRICSHTVTLSSLLGRHPARLSKKSSSGWTLRPRSMSLERVNICSIRLHCHHRHSILPSILKIRNQKDKASPSDPARRVFNIYSRVSHYYRSTRRRYPLHVIQDRGLEETHHNIKAQGFIICTTAISTDSCATKHPSHQANPHEHKHQNECTKSLKETPWSATSGKLASYDRMIQIKLIRYRDQDPSQIYTSSQYKERECSD